MGEPTATVRLGADMSPQPTTALRLLVVHTVKARSEAVHLEPFPILPNPSVSHSGVRARVHPR